MSGPARVGDLELEQDLDFQRGMWTAQRVAWIVMALLLIAAFLGLFSGGPLSQATAGEEGGTIWLQYARFGRWEAPVDLEIYLGPSAVTGDQAQVWLDRTFVQEVEIQTIEPEPSQVLVSSDRYVYVFDVASLDESALITFTYTPARIGTLSGRSGVLGGPELAFQAFVYP